MKKPIKFCGNLFVFAWSISMVFAGPYIDAAIQISTDHYTLTFNEKTGDLVGVVWKERPNIPVISEPRLGENFRLLLPLEDYEANYFLSRDQKVSRIEQIDNGVVCHYERLGNVRQEIDVQVRYMITETNGQLHFRIAVRNNTDQPLAEVFFGIIGGQQGIGNRLDTESLITGVNYNAGANIFNKFGGGGYGGGNLGILHSQRKYAYPSWGMTMPWLNFYNAHEDISLYYADQDTVNRQSALYFELHPYNKNAVVGDDWPAPDDVPEDTPIGLTMGWLKFPYTTQATFESEPVALQMHKGDWRTSSGIYRSWFDGHFALDRPPSWLRTEMAWQSIIMSNPEDVINCRFTDLPKIAADAKKYGVTTFEIIGWNVGGNDRGFPQYTPDPRLGTVQEFKEALAEIKAMGMHPIIFTNIFQFDTSTPLYKNEFAPYAIKGKWADDIPLEGWGYGTIGAHYGFTRHNMTNVSPYHKKALDLHIAQFEDLVRWGAEGIQIDKLLRNGLDFNPLLPVSPDRSIVGGMVLGMQKTLEAGRRINPDFAIAGECTWDRSFQYLDVSYMRMGAIDMHPSLRYTFPEWTATIFAENPGDFNIMNNGMRYGLVWALAPRHYNASMDEELTRPLSEYVQELIRIRKKHQDILFHGRFLDTEGLLFEGDEHTRYSVFEGMDNPEEKACVLVNFGNESVRVQVGGFVGSKSHEVEILQPFKADKKGMLPLSMEIPPETCIVIKLINK